MNDAPAIHENWEKIVHVHSQGSQILVSISYVSNALGLQKTVVGVSTKNGSHSRHLMDLISELLGHYCDNFWG